MNNILDFSYASISQSQQAYVFGGVDSSGTDADPSDDLSIVTEFEEDNEPLMTVESGDDTDSEIYFSLSDIAAL